MVVHIVEKPKRLLVRTAVASLIVGISLFIVKLSAYAITGSAAILSDAAESIINIITAVFATYSIKTSQKPPDKGHPYGHGKIEFFSAAFEGGAIIVAASWIIYRSIDELIKGPTLHSLDIGIYLLIFATVVNLILGCFLMYIGKKSASIILAADGKHILTDVLTTIGIIAGLWVVASTEWLFLDSIIAIFVAINIIFVGWKLLKNATGGMMDASCKEDDEIIKKTLKLDQFQNVCGCHKLRHRHSGGMHFVDFHLCLPKGMTIEASHAIATAVEAQVASALGDASVMAHIEPCKNPTCPKCGVANT